MTKEEIRIASKQMRENISIIQAAEMSVRISVKALSLPEYKQAESVLSYASLFGEVSTTAFNAKMLADGKKLYLPKVTGKGTMEIVRVTDLSSLQKSKMHIPEPQSDDYADPMQIDIAFIPGIAFDKKGGRVGFGGGYYDRLLPCMKALRIALGFELQIVDDALNDDRDAKMHMLLTENGVYHFNR